MPYDFLDSDEGKQKKTTQNRLFSRWLLVGCKEAYQKYQDGIEGIAGSQKNNAEKEMRRVGRELYLIFVCVGGGDW